MYHSSSGATVYIYLFLSCQIITYNDSAHSYDESYYRHSDHTRVIIFVKEQFRHLFYRTICGVEMTKKGRSIVSHILEAYLS